jgi:hypothetical protein
VTTVKSVPLARSVDVPLRRLGPWLAGFRQRHPDVDLRPSGEPPGVGRRWELTSSDGHRAVVEVPEWLSDAVASELAADPVMREAAVADELAADRLRRRAVVEPAFAVLVVRRAGYAAAVFRGGERLWGKVGRRHVHGRTAAGGWSQQRYARRRANQADEIVSAVAATFAREVTPHVPKLEAFASGGDRRLLSQAREVLAQIDPRLATTLEALPEVRLAMGTPTAADLAAVPDRVLAVRIHLTGTLEGGGSDD